VKRIDTAETRVGLRMLAAAVVQAGLQALKFAVVAATESAKHTPLFKDVTGGTRGSIRGEVLGRTGFVVARGAAYFLEHGTRPHTIEAHGTALRFVVNGAVLFRKMVRHPGTAERPFMAEARAAGLVAFDRAAVSFVNYAIARA
jgi:hypothetical protein